MAIAYSIGTRMNHIINDVNATWLFLRVDSGYNVFLVTVSILMHNAKECDGTFNGTGGRKDTSTAIGESNDVFSLSLGSIKVTIERCYVMPLSCVIQV